MMKPVKAARRRFGADNSGAHTLEFALVAPLLFAAVFGVFEAGRALYERNRIAAAAAIASRTVAMNPAASDTDLETAILGKLDDYDPDDLTITLLSEDIAGQTFKKIEITYDHSLLVHFGHHLSGFTLTAVRYAPVAPTP